MYNYINYVFIQNGKENMPNKSTKPEGWWNNLSMWNDFKEGNSIIFETEVNIPNHEIRVIHLLGFFTWLCIVTYFPQNLCLVDT